jgi:hypothetical protein
LICDFGFGIGAKSKTLTKDFDASDEFLRSNDFELGTKSDMFREVSSVRGEKPVRSGFEGRDKYGNIGLMTDQMAMPIDFLLGWKRNKLWIKQSQQRAVSVYGFAA